MSRLTRNIAGAVLTAVALLGTTLPAASAQPTAEPEKHGPCFYRTSQSKHTDTMYTAWAAINIRYYVKCLNDGGYRVHLHSDKVSWYSADSHDEWCNTVVNVKKAWRHIDFNLYLKDGYGHNYHPHGIRMECRSDTSGHYTQNLLDDNIYLFTRGFTLPQWRVNIDMDIAMGVDQHRTLHGRLTRFGN